MSKKADHSVLRSQLEVLNNKELHHKCVEHGLNVPVADSTRDVIIRKLIKTITGDATVTSPKTNKKPSSTSTDRRKTVNVTVHVSSDEETERKHQQPTSKNRTRTQSPKGHNVTFDASINNNRRTNAASPAKPKQQKTPVDANANIGVGLGGNARMVPIEMDISNTYGLDEHNIKVRASGTGITQNKNQGLNFGGSYNTSQQNHDNGLKGTSSNLNVSQTRLLNNTYKQGLSETPFSSYVTPSSNMEFSQTRAVNANYQQNAAISPRQGFIPAPPEPTNNSSFLFHAAGSPTHSFNIENRASHSSMLGSNFSGSPPTAKEPLFKRPNVLSKSNVTSTSYNQEDAQRLYPRLPTDLVTPPTYAYSPPSTPESQQSTTHSGRAPSLTKSGVMTTSYYQEISPVKEVKHYEVESGEEPAEYGAGDYDRNNIVAGANYERSNYLAGIKSGAEAHLPFEQHLHSTLRDPLYTSPPHTNSPQSREAYIPSAAAPISKSSPILGRYATTARANISYTRSIDEPDSGSEGEKLSSDEIYVNDSEDEEYMADSKKIYSSYGSNKIQERVPYRRSNATRLNASPTARYSHSLAGRHSANNDDDDVNASMKNFLTTLDRKYHIKQMMYMFGIFATAVFIYVVFFEKTPSSGDDVFIVQP